MAYIRVIDEDKAEGPLFKVYDEVQQTRGRVSNVMRAQSLDPKGLRSHLELYMALLYGKGPLSRFQKELVGVVVSVANGCEYCWRHHGEALRKYAKDDAFVAQAQKDHTKLKLEPKDKALCDFAMTLTKSPGADHGKSVEALRAAGFDDEGILQATEVVSYFNFVTRLAKGLGVSLEGEDPQDFNY